MLLHNDVGGVGPAAAVVVDRFGGSLDGVRTALDDLRDNFADVHAQGAIAYADEMAQNHPTFDHRNLLGDAVTAIGEFHAALANPHHSTGD